MKHSLSSLAAVGQKPMAALNSIADLAGQEQQDPQQDPQQAKNAIEAAMFERLEKNYPDLVKEYFDLPESSNGRILNTDVARELSPDYRADRTKSADVHEPSSAFIKKVYADRLEHDTPKGLNSEIVFTAGGTGAGKTTALNASKNISDQVKKAEMIYDTNMNKLESSDKKIQQALKAGRNVSIMYTYRDPVEALTQGALSRASRMEKELGTGRTVPIDEHLKTHIGARKTVEQLINKYADNDKVKIHVIDNSRGRGKAALSSIDKLPQLNEHEVRGKLHEALESERASGRISDAIYRGTKGNR